MYSNYNLLSALNVLSRLSLNQYKVVHHVCATPLYKHFCKQKQAVFNPQMEHYILKGRVTRNIVEIILIFIVHLNKTKKVTNKDVCSYSKHLSLTFSNLEALP